MSLVLLLTCGEMTRDIFLAQQAKHCTRR